MASHTPGAQRTLIKDAKFPKSGPVLSYVNATRFLVGSVVGDGKMGGPLREHEAEIAKLVTAAPIPLPKDVQGFRINPSSATPWNYQGVEISMHPDVELRGPKGTGVLKFYCGVEPLARTVGGSMAALLHYHRSTVLKLSDAHAGYCIVYEVRTAKSHKAGATSAKLLDNVQAACQLATLWWPLVTN